MLCIYVGARTGCVVVRWCTLDISTIAIIPLWEVHLPISHCPCSSEPSLNLLVVGVDRSLVVYGSRGRIGSVSLPSEATEGDIITGIAVLPSSSSSNIQIIVSWLDGSYWRYVLQSTGGNFSEGEVELASSKELFCGRSSCPSTTSPSSRHHEMCPLEATGNELFSSFLPFFHKLYVIHHVSSGGEWEAVGVAAHDSVGFDLVYFREKEIQTGRNDARIDDQLTDIG